MKTKILIVSIITILIFSICTLAQDTEYSIVIPDNFTATHKDDNIQAVAKILALEENTLNDYFSKNGTLYLAVSNDAKTQIRLSAFNDNFSSEIGDISLLNQDALNEFIVAVGGNSNQNIVESNGRKFIITKSVLNDSGGVYTVTQYITIANNKTYYLSCYNEGNDTSDQINKIFSTFNIFEKEAEIPNFKAQMLFTWGGIVIFSAVAVFMIIGIIKTAVKHKN